jgi:hypothetical protein
MTEGTDKEEAQQLGLATPKSSLTWKAGKSTKLLLYLSDWSILSVAKYKELLHL